VTSHQATGASRLDRIVELDGLRGLISLVVVGFHVYQGSWEDPGAYAFPMYSLPDIAIRYVGPMLTVFFILTGFGVMAPLLAKALAGRSGGSRRRFLIRRLAAVVPLYLVVIFVVWEARYGGSLDQWLDLLRSLTFSQIYSDDRIFRIVGPAWFIAVLVHWYVIVAVVVMPLLDRIARLGDRRARLRCLYAIAAVLIVAGLAWKGIGWARGVPLDGFATWFNWPVWLDSIGLGMVMAILVVDRGLPRRGSIGVAAGLVLTGLGLHWTLAPLQAGSHAVSAYYWTLGAIAWTLVVAAVIVAPRDAFMRRALRARVPLFLGAIGITTYLLQDPLLRSLKARDLLPFEDPQVFPLAALAGLVAAVALGAVAHFVLERPVTQFVNWLIADRRPREPRVRGVWALQPGVPIPAHAPVTTPAGQLDLASVAGAGPLVIVTFPGIAASHGRPELAGWRPLLHELRDWRFAVEAQGGRIVGVSRLEPDALARIADEERLGFDLASDPDGGFLTRLGIPTIDADGSSWAPPAIVIAEPPGRVVAVLPAEEGPFDVGLEIARRLQSRPAPVPSGPSREGYPRLVPGAATAQ
jgi:peptidoglycan/LPS O-acetylase OafA/YrhL